MYFQKDENIRILAFFTKITRKKKRPTCFLLNNYQRKIKQKRE